MPWSSLLPLHMCVHWTSAAVGDPGTGPVCWLRMVCGHVSTLLADVKSEAILNHPAGLDQKKGHLSGLTELYEITNDYCSKPLYFGVICVVPKATVTDTEA